MFKGESTMKHANGSVFPILTLKAQNRARWITIFLTALLGFASVPSASAKCLSRDFRQPISRPALASAAALAAPGASGITPAGRASIVGLWNITFFADGQPFDYGFDVFYADGNELLNDVTPTIEGNICVGVWQQIAPRTYTLKHVTWNFDTSGNLSGSGVFYQTLHLSPDGNSYTGTVESIFYDLSGNLTGQFAGTIEATRIKPA
jgi:hypothetical protein